MRIRDWSSDVCSSDLPTPKAEPPLRRSVSPLTKKGGTGGNGRPDWRLPGRFAFPLWGNGGRNEGERPVGQFADRPPFAPAPPARGRDTAPALALSSAGAGPLVTASCRERGVPH